MKIQVSLNNEQRDTLYTCWMNMKARCNNPNHPRYEDYGGRGIKVCSEWNNSFTKFAEDMYPKPFKEAQLDRINNEGNYEPSNVRWSSRSENRRNCRDTIYVNVDGEDKILADLYDELKPNMDYKTLRMRITDLGWDIDRALNTPVRRYLKKRTTIIDEYEEC